VSNKSGVSAHVIAFPSGGGTLKGIGEKFSPVLHTGTGSLSVPIVLSLVRSEFQPEFTLGHSTEIDNGSFRLGWNLSMSGLVQNWRTIELPGNPRDDLQGGASGDVDAHMSFTFTRRMSYSRARQLKRLERRTIGKTTEPSEIGRCTVEAALASESDFPGQLAIGAPSEARHRVLKGASNMYRSPFSRLFIRTAEELDRRIGWHKLPRPLGLAALIGLRERLRERNLHDPSMLVETPVPEDGRVFDRRTVDGSYNDLKNPAMGKAGTPFGRNVPLQEGHPETDWAICNDPNPRTVSRELLTRDVFQPATTLNLLAAAWIQFMIRDWFSHGRGKFEERWELELAKGDPWRKERGGPMQIPRTPGPVSNLKGYSPPAFANTETHWWDGSQLYGSTKEQQAWVRGDEKDGKLRLDKNKDIPEDILEKLATEPGWWVGLALMYTIFMREHNAICEHLRAAYPDWLPDDIFERARLINAALMAKIHTVEWTTALLGHPVLQVAMNANWWGLATERVHKLYGRLSENEIVSGIPGSARDHFKVPYSVTEEFVAVYKMHPMIPDHFDFRSVNNNESLSGQHRTLREISGKYVRELLEQTEDMTDLIYSFGTTYPGAVTLHNYPRFLQDFERPDGKFMDLAATDILRTRELGVPRYNEFRRLLGRPPVRAFEELTDNQAWVEELRRVYDDEVDKVDLITGLFAEPKPAGFGISDTAFRIFILMASRRLNSDRFYTTDYTPEVYTPEGMDWIANNTMSTVLTRHYSKLMPSLYRIKNAFAPWPKARTRGV
jgi:hypothetical protein